MTKSTMPRNLRAFGGALLKFGSELGPLELAIALLAAGSFLLARALCPAVANAVGLLVAGGLLLLTRLPLEYLHFSSIVKKKPAE